MRRSVRTCQPRVAVAVVGSVFISCGEALAGGFGVEQSAYYQGMSFAGAAAGGPSLASISWNPATAGFFGNGLTLESSYSVVLMSAEHHGLQSAGSAGDGSGRNRDGPQCPRRGELRHLAARPQDGAGLEPHLAVRARNQGQEPGLGRQLRRGDDEPLQPQRRADRLLRGRARRSTSPRACRSTISTCSGRRPARPSARQTCGPTTPASGSWPASTMRRRPPPPSVSVSARPSITPLKAT